MKIDDAVVLITGANRGIGLAFARAALARGARKVYAAARDPASVTLPGVVPVRLDVTNAEQVAAAAAACGDVTLLINNAGIAEPGGWLDAGAAESAQRQFDVNFHGLWRMSAAFAPLLAKNGGGALLNVLSVTSWMNSPPLQVYGGSKAAAWALTNGLRNELRGRGTQVLAMHTGFIDTDLTRAFDAPKTAPGVVVGVALDALEAGADEVLGDPVAQAVKAGLSATPASYTQTFRR